MSGLLQEISEFDLPGCWAGAAERAGWPYIFGPRAAYVYEFAKFNESIPYGSYVMLEYEGLYGGKEDKLAVHPSYIDRLLKDYELAGQPTSKEVREKADLLEALKHCIALLGGINLDAIPQSAKDALAESTNQRSA